MHIAGLETICGGGVGNLDNLPCDLSHDAFDITNPQPPPCGQMPVKTLPSW